MSRIFDEILKKRGFSEEFLNPKYFSGAVYLPDIDKAVERIKKAIRKHEKVLVYGDYDVDGVTATTLMVKTLKMAGITEVETMLPDRFVDGYGMSERCVERAKNIEAKLVITVDCGSGNVEIVQKLTEVGIDTIVTDHHEIIGKMAEAVAVVNPKRTDFEELRDSSKKYQEGAEKYSVEALRGLAGVGVAFMVAKCLVAEKLIAEGQEKWLLDLVLIGTICDSMEMNVLNRELTYYGVKVLEKTRRPGLIELMRVAKITKITSHAIGFQIGPRLNAGGRMESAEISLKLLLSESKAEAAVLAAKLDKLNNNRRDEQQDAIREIDTKGVGEKPVIVVKGKWHEGVIGIIAGRLVEKYHRPAFVLTWAESVDGDADGVIEESEKVLKGSGRSFGDFNLAEALKYCSEVMIGGGGHAGACGVKVLESRFRDFEEKMNEFYERCELKNQEKYLVKEADIEVEGLREVTVELTDEISRLEPFGEGNEEPIFRLKNMFVLNVSTMGREQQHLCVSVQGRDGGGVMKLVAFNAQKEWMGLEKGEQKDFLVSLERDEWKGRIEVEGVIVGVSEVSAAD